MSRVIEKYTYTDSDGDIQKFNYIQSTCMCAGKCEPDIIEHFDLVNGEYDGPYNIKLETTEATWLFQDLIEMGVNSGKLLKDNTNE